MWQKIIDKIKTALTGNSLLHGAYTATIIAGGQALLPIAEAWSNSTTAPSFNFTTFWHLEVGVFVGYLIKNAVFGSSAKASTPPAQ